MSRDPSTQADIDAPVPSESNRMEQVSLPEKQQILTIGGVQTFLFEAGEGKPVVLFHGASIGVDAWLTWFRCFDVLALDHRVIAYDQPCFGRSGIPDDGKYMDRERRAMHAQALFDQLDLSGVTLVGHSEGGFIATRLALDNRDRVERLVVVTSGGTSPRLNDERDMAWMTASAAAYDYQGRAIDEDAYVRSEGHLRYREDPPFEAILRHNYRLAQKAGTAKCLLDAAHSRSGYSDYTMLQERLLFPRLPSLNIPALLIWAGRDATVPVARGLALADLLPMSEIHIFPRAGHWVMHEETAPFNALLAAWLSQEVP